MLGLKLNHVSKRGHSKSYVVDVIFTYGPLTRYAKLRVAHAPVMLGTFSPPPLQLCVSGKRPMAQEAKVATATILTQLARKLIHTQITSFWYMIRVLFVTISFAKKRASILVLITIYTCGFADVLILYRNNTSFKYQAIMLTRLCTKLFCYIYFLGHNATKLFTHRFFLSPWHEHYHIVIPFTDWVLSLLALMQKIWK